MTLGEKRSNFLQSFPKSPVGNSQCARIREIAFNSFIGNMKKRIKSFVIPKRSKITIKGWEDTERMNNKNEGKGEWGKRRVQRVQMQSLWNEWSQKTNQFQS